MAELGNIHSIGTAGWWPVDAADMASVGTAGWWLGIDIADLVEALGAGALTDAGIGALCGSRVYRTGHVPQDAGRPYLVYERMGDAPARDQGGQTLREGEYRFHCVADDLNNAVPLGDAVLAWLDNFRGTMGLAGRIVTIRRAELTDRHSALTNPTDGSARGPQIVQQDYTIFYVP